ncbi:MAG: tyrosine-protein phosphatase [Ilumatobacteraceae bacterium]
MPPDHELHDLLAATRHPNRLVALDAVHNFRDLGGYPTHSGRMTRWRTLFRADGLYRLTPADLDVVRGLQLRTVIDLRTEQEITNYGRFPLEYHPITFHHVPVMDSTWHGLERDDIASRDPADFLEWAYLDMLDGTPERFARAFSHLCEAEVLPAVFHCAAGKDRTGVLSMMVLGALGVPDEIIVADYALTSEATVRMREWARRSAPELLTRLDAAPASFLASVPEAMRRIIATVNGRHGSIGGMVRAFGVTDAEIAHLESMLLDG